MSCLFSRCFIKLLSADFFPFSYNFDCKTRIICSPFYFCQHCPLWNTSTQFLLLLVSGILGYQTILWFIATTTCSVHQDRQIKLKTDKKATSTCLEITVFWNDYGGRWGGHRLMYGYQCHLWPPPSSASVPGDGELGTFACQDLSLCEDSDNNKNPTTSVPKHSLTPVGYFTTKTSSFICMYCLIAVQKKTLISDSPNIQYLNPSATGD